MVANSKQAPSQKVCDDCVDRVDKMGLLGRRGSFDKALHIILSFCERHKDFERYKKEEVEKWKDK